MRQLVFAVVVCGALAACVDPYSNQSGQFGVNNTTGGTLIGAGLGGLLGNQFGGGSGKALATVAGVVAGGLIGNRIGSSMDEAQARATQTALETGQPNQALPWRNPDNGHSGSVTPGAYTQDASGQYCREFTQTINVGGDSQPQQAYGRACRQPDGTWKITQN